MIIYKITNKINNKVYIGQTTSSIKNRWNAHCRSKKCVALWRAIQKYGKENFTIEEIDGANSLSELNYLEQHYIYMYNSLAPNGYNLMSGGGNAKHSQESKNKISFKNKGKKRKPRSNEYKRKMSLVKTGVLRGPASEEVKEKLRKSLTGRVFTKEHQLNLSNANKKRGTKVFCLETNTIYCSYGEAANILKIHRSTVEDGIKTGKTVKGLHLKRYD